MPETLPASARTRLLDIAAASILNGFEVGAPIVVDVDVPALRVRQATFVTLTRDGALRGCMGSIEAHRTLAADVACNAFAAAFRDPRFARLTAVDSAGLRVEISVLSAPERLRFVDEQELVAQLEQRRDGVIVRWQDRRATYLPAVWQKVPDAGEFVRQLRAKAGIPDALPVSRIEFERYGVECFGGALLQTRAD